MTTSVQRRRGTTAQHSTFTGLEGEITVDTTKDTAVVHDGSTAGGFPLAREDLSNIAVTSLTALTGSGTASDDLFIIYDTSTSSLKKITRDELNNAIEQDALANVTITGGSINGTTVGASSASTGAFTSLSASGAFSANGGATLGDASGDALTINSSAVSIPNGLNFDSNTFVIDATNNYVGINTASAGTALQVNKDWVTDYGSINISHSTNSLGGLAIRCNNVYKGGLIYRGGTSGGFLELNAAAIEPLVFKTNAVERMRIDSSGNVGIGTSSPQSKLHIAGSTFVTGDTGLSGVTADGITTRFLSSVAYLQAINISSGTVSGGRDISFDGNQLLFRTISGASFTERMRLDNSGNLGLGVTPSAWNGLYKSIEVGSAGNSLASYLGTRLYYNAYYSAGGINTYGTSSTAALYIMPSTGGHQWFTAPSGTAGNAITFTQAMTLAASGNLGIGSTSPSQKLHIGLSADSSNYLQVTASSTNAYFGIDTNGVYVGSDTAAKSVNFYTVGTERARITSDGYLRMASGSLGIQFNGDTAAANALDDYEEGTFTPTVYGTTTAGTGTYTSQVGRYTKIGNVVYFYAFIGWTAHTGTGNLNVTSLPFTSVSATDTVPIINIVGSSLTFTGQLYGSKTSNSINIEIRTFTTNASTAAVAMDTSATIILTGFYYAA